MEWWSLRIFKSSVHWICRRMDGERHADRTIDIVRRKKIHCTRCATGRVWQQYSKHARADRCWCAVHIVSKCQVTRSHSGDKKVLWDCQVPLAGTRSMLADCGPHWLVEWIGLWLARRTWSLPARCVWVQQRVRDLRMTNLLTMMGHEFRGGTIK